MPLRWIFVSVALLAGLAGAGEGGRVLLLNSYHRSEWTDAVQRGVETALAGRPGCDVVVDYLDCKRAQSAGYLAQVAALHRVRYAGERFLAVIAVDDQAFRYALDHQADLFAGLPVAFCGVNTFDPPMTTGHRAGGVCERGDIPATLALALRLRPQTRRVLLLCDRTQAGLEHRQEFEAVIAPTHPELAIETCDYDDVAGLSARLARAGAEEIAFLVSCWKMTEGRVLLPRELEAALRASAVPVFGRSEWMVGKGLLGGLCVSGEAHGRAAGTIALQLVDGVAATSLPGVDCPNTWLFDHAELVRHGLDQHLLPATARIHGQPPPGVRMDPSLLGALVLALLSVTAAALALAKAARCRGRTASELREARDRLAAVLDGVNDAVFIQCPDSGRIIDANRRAGELFGYTIAELRLMAVGGFSAGDEGYTEAVAQQHRLAAISAPQVFAWRGLARDGRRFWSEVALNLAVVGGERRLLMVVRDVDDQRRVELERDRLFAASIDLLGVAGLDGRFRQLNPAWTATLGWSQEELLTRPWLEFVHPEDHEQTLAMAAVLGEGCPVRAFENRILHRDGSWRRLSWTSQALPSEGLVFSVVRDVTALHQAEAARRQTQAELARQEADLAAILDAIGDAVLAVDGAGRISRLNPVAETLTGWPDAQARGHPLAEVLHLLDPTSRARLDGPGAHPRPGSGRALCVDRAGAERLVTELVEPLHDHAGGLAGSVIVLRDVTEEAALQERLAHAERLDAIGRLAGGVAHDFNNMLTGVTGAVELIRLRLTEGSELLQWADLALESSRRAADLTRQLLAFARKHAVRSEIVDLDHAVARVVAMLGRTIDRRICLLHRPAASPALVRGDPTQIESSLLNLGLNARDALPAGGELRYEVDVVEAPPHPGLPSRLCGRIRVVDNGVGIPAAVLPRIFEPFFTTKELGRGTGLGLAAVHGMAASHGGSVTVSSEAGQGSVFTLLLPAEVAAATARRAPEPTVQVVSGRQVLIVDDEASLRELIRAQVESLGWSSVAAADGAAALACFTANPAAFDVVLLDLLMPVLDGHETFARLRARRPRLPVVVMSGYDPSAGGAERLVEQGAVFLQKPFTCDALATALNRALADGRG